MPMDNVKRIEFVRGPGSALYGSGAYDGVINVITKGAEDIDGVELTARGGSWDTQQYNLLFGKTLSDLEVVLNFNYFKTHGHSALIEEDMWTEFDRNIRVPFFGLPPLSLAPGHTKSPEERYDLALNLKFKGFTLDGRYVDRDFYGLGLLKDRWLPEEYYLNLNYETTIRDGLDLSIKGYRQQLSIINDYVLIPPGLQPAPIQNPTPPPEVIFPSVWPEGFLERYLMKDYRIGIEIQSTYKIHDSMTIVAGATYEKQKLMDTQYWNNYLWPDTPEGLFVQFPSLQSAWRDPGGRQNYLAFFLEDIWDITQSIRLTTGLRYDKYYEWEFNDLSLVEAYEKRKDREGLSEFSFDIQGHFSPRVGLTWEFVKGYDLKLLYGHAFLVPNLYELLWAPGFKLDPQTVDTYEISLGAEFTSSMKGRITFYQRDEKDFIVCSLPAPACFTNTGELRSRGVEVEARYNLGRGTYLAGNYHYSSWPDDATDYYQEANIPEYVGKIMANIRLSRHFNLYADCQHFGGMSRESEGDLRDKTSDYTIVNATLIARKFLKCCEGLELRASVYNLFDEDWSQFVDNIPYGWQQPGRNYLLELKYSL